MAIRSEVFRIADIVVQVLGMARMTETGRGDLPLFHRDQVLIGFLRPLGSLRKPFRIWRAGASPRFPWN